MTKNEEFKQKVVEDITASLTKEEASKLERETGYPDYFKDGGIYTATLMEVLEENGLLSQYEENELKWSESKSGKMMPPHMYALFSSSRIALFYFLSRSDIQDFKSEVCLPILDEVSGIPPHLDFSYIDKEGVEHFVECKTTEVCSEKDFMMKKRHLPSINMYSGIQYQVLQDEEFADFSYEWMGRRSDVVSRGKKSYVDFKQLICHILGIFSKIDEEKNPDKKYVLDYCYFTPSFYKEHPYKDEIERELKAFKESRLYNNLLFVRSGQFVLTDPSYPCIKDVEDPVLKRIFEMK